MKRTLGKIGFFCFCLACLEPVSMGQVSWGVKTGLNATTTTYGSEQNSGYQLGFNAGAYTKLPLGSRFFLLGELSYSPKGNPIFGGSHLSLQYLSLPLLAGYKLVGNLALVAGPTCSYLIQAKFKPDINHFDPTHYYRPLDYGFDVGLRYQFTHHMGADFRWDRGYRGSIRTTSQCICPTGMAFGHTSD